MKRWPRVTGTWWAIEIDSPHPPIFLPLSVASQGDHLMVACSQQHPEQVGTGHKNKWGGEKSTQQPQMICSQCGKLGCLWVDETSVLIHLQNYWGFIENMEVALPSWSCLAEHLRLMCRFRKLATRLKLFPRKNKNNILIKQKLILIANSPAHYCLLKMYTLWFFQ